ncbi:PREDICTED: contactin-associated protein-like 2 [Acropora digitifera]|uniref:contactin-associated protein-like 2 n=1 Tax=Acropora digitifera TaxID=70779 RepID=UPI00077A3E6C|nr:PREDICTED: contactin-associated protein-like 2 [Acropora digitifera]
MSHVTFAIWPFFVPLLISANAWLQSALFHHRFDIFSYGNFTQDAERQLAVTKLKSFVLDGPVNCVFRCIGEPQCLSFNLAAYPDSKGFYQCDLLASDKYRAAAKDFQANGAFHHYSPWSLCRQTPCQNSGTCIPSYELNSYHCICAPGFAAFHCERKGKSCSEIKHYSPQATSGSYVIDPDEEGSQGPLTVFCDMTDKNGVGVTIISHDSEARTRVKGYEESGSYVRNVHYTATGLTDVSQLAFLADVSTHCEQFIKYECRKTALFRYNSGWWVSRTGAKMTYWGGATPADRNKCACGVTSPNSCASTAYGCNCDKNDGTFREDSGLLKRKSHLPVIQLRFGDTGHSGEEGFHTLGKLKCYGMQ